MAAVDSSKVDERKMPPSEDWCRECHPDLPTHKHRPDGSLRVLRADGTVSIVINHNLSVLFQTTSELPAVESLEALKVVKQTFCLNGVLQCGSCLPSCPPLKNDFCMMRKSDVDEGAKKFSSSPSKEWCRNCSPNLPAHKPREDGSCLMQKSDEVEGLKEFKFSSSSSEDEDWCKKCNSNLPPHKHREDGSWLVKTAVGAEVIEGLAFSCPDGRVINMPVSSIFESPNLTGKPLDPMAVLAALKQYQHKLPKSVAESLCQNAQKMTPSTPCTASTGRGGDENWDLDKALEFIEGTEAAPQSNKKAKKKKKKVLSEKSEHVLEQKNNIESTSNEEEKNNTIESQPKGDARTERVNSEPLKDGCKQRSATPPVGEVKGGSSRCFESENSRSRPSVLSSPPGIAGDVEELEAPRNLKVEPMESKVKGRSICSLFAVP